MVVPPLRERAEDIPLLVEYFVGRFAKEAGKTIRHIGKANAGEVKELPLAREHSRIAERRRTGSHSQ
jgi:transcriptional regulator with GAF, ATPase, and Fis domain